MQSTASGPIIRTSPDDPRIAAFCSAERPEVFHAVAYRNDVWKEDPFDVETIHEAARATFDALADQVVMDDRFNAIDLDLVRALLFLQSHDPRIKGRVLKYLRCEDLSAQDRALLGGIVPRTYDDAPQWIIQRLGELTAALES